MSIDVAYIGLGVMGKEMARHLAHAGNRVTVWNRTHEKAEAFAAAHGGRSAPSVARAVRDAEVILTCVGDDDDLRQVVLGEGGVLSAAKRGSLIVDHTTASAEIARVIAGAASARGVAFVDAPVSGGQQGAIKGALTIMCGGSVEDFARAERVVAPYALSCVRMGDVGAGQLTKMVNQICFAGVIAGLAEGMAFAENSGLDVARVIEVISKGAASSWQMLNRHETMIAREYAHGFAVDWMRKDLRICAEEAARNQSELPVASMVAGFYADVQAMGGGRWDTSSLVERLRVRRATAG
jgi:3-hydroxyisobutyrate dehydrogenase-like beta-hydroxyacid dehydrogenase